MDWPYLAGFFDGEGCVSIGRNDRPCCTIAQSVGSHNVLQQIKEFLLSQDIACNVHQHVRPVAGRKKAEALWISSSVAVEDFLKNLLPHLIVKREKAETALMVIA